jgi:ketosteroid isomerase-like protein
MTDDEDAICDLLDDFARALYEKDAAGAIAPLADDAVAFDLAPPLKQDPDVMHDSARLEEWFATWKSPIVSEAVEGAGDGHARYVCSRLALYAQSNSA